MKRQRVVKMRPRVAGKMSARQKVLAVEAQIRSMMDGQLAEFTCPFCELVTTEGMMFCCNEAAEVVNAVLDHVEHLERTQIVEQALDRFSAAESRVILN